jgi:hypothetical protein
MLFQVAQVQVDMSVCITVNFMCSGIGAIQTHIWKSKRRHMQNISYEDPRSQMCLYVVQVRVRSTHVYVQI